GRSSPSMLALDTLRLAAVLGLASSPQMPDLLNRQIEQLGDAPLWLTELDELADRSSHPRLHLGDPLAQLVTVIAELEELRGGLLDRLIPKSTLSIQKDATLPRPSSSSGLGSTRTSSRRHRHQLHPVNCGQQADANTTSPARYRRCASISPPATHPCRPSPPIPGHAKATRATHLLHLRGRGPVSISTCSRAGGAWCSDDDDPSAARRERV